MPKPQTPRRMLMTFYVILLIVGLSLYWAWAYLYNAWTDIGLFSIVILLIGFGVIGTALYSRRT